MTVKDLIDAAYSRSTFNDPDKLATDKELTAVVDRRLKELYSLAAGQNPFYFGGKQAIAGVGGEWAKPSNMEMLIKVTKADGTEVSVVPFEDQEAEIAPRIYQFGNKYYVVGSDLTATETLTFWYSARPTDLSLPSSVVPAEFPAQFSDLIVLHLSKYLAVKDQRGEEVSLLDAEEQRIMANFIRHLQHENYAMVARWGHRARLVSQGPVGFREG